MNQPVTLTQRSHLMGHHNTHPSPKNILPSISPNRPNFFPVPFQPLGQPPQMIPTQSIYPPTLQNPQAQIATGEKTTTSRLPFDRNAVVSAFLLSPQGEREVDFKIVGDDFMRMKDIKTEYCYKFRVVANTPLIRFSTVDALRFRISFSGDYIEDLVKFFGAIQDPRFNIQLADRAADFEFRFKTAEAKAQFNEVLQVVSKVSLPSQPTHQSLLTSNNNVPSPVLSNNVVDQASSTIHTINQGQKSERVSIDRVQHVNAVNVPQSGLENLVTPKQLIQPPVHVLPFPSATQPLAREQTARVVETQQQVIQTQANKAQSGAETEVLRLVEENNILSNTVRSHQNDLALVNKDNQRLQVELQNLRQQIQLNKEPVRTDNGEVVRLRAESSQLSQALAMAERKLNEIQTELSRSRSAEAEAKNEKEVVRVNFTKQVSDLERKLNLASSSAVANSSETLHLRNDYEEQRRLNQQQLIEIISLQQQLSDANLNHLNLQNHQQRGPPEEPQELIGRYEEQLTNMEAALQQRSYQSEILSEQLKAVRSGVTSEVHLRQTPQFQELFENEKMIFIQEYNLMRGEKEREISLLNQKIEHLLVEDFQKFNIIQQLEAQLNRLLNGPNTSNSSVRLETVDRIRTFYDEENKKLRGAITIDIGELNNKIRHYQQVSEDYQLKYARLLEEYQILSRSPKQDGIFGNAGTSQGQSEERLRNHIEALQSERENLLELIQSLRNQLDERDGQLATAQQQYDQEEVTITTYQTGSNPFDQEKTIERVTYQPANEENGDAETEVIERVTYDRAGHEEVETIERVTYPIDSYGQQQQVITYEIDDGSEKYIHKEVIDRFGDVITHQVDTNVTVHREDQQVTYDIETEETTYEGNSRLGYYAGDNQSRGIVYNTREGSQHSGRQVMYHGDNVDVIYHPKAGNLTVEGGEYMISIPEGEAQRISITEETYETRRGGF